MTKIKKIISIDKLDQEVIKALVAKYPDGWKNHIKKIDKGNGSFFYAITVDYAEFSYLIKVDVKVDSMSQLEKEEKKEDFDEIPDEEMEVEFDDDVNYEDGPIS